MSAEEDKREHDKQMEDIREVLALPAGRRFYHRLMGICRTFKESFVVGMSDVTANNEGRRSVGNWLLAEMLEADPERYFQMCREYKSEMVKKELIKKQEETDA